VRALESGESKARGAGCAGRCSRQSREEERRAEEGHRPIQGQEFVSTSRAIDFIPLQARKESEFTFAKAPRFPILPVNGDMGPILASEFRDSAC
jgi:hypothetical protein